MSMQMEFIKVLPSPQALMEDYPISQASKLLKLQRDEEIKNIFTGKDDRFLMVIGPCSSSCLSSTETSILIRVTSVSSV